MHYVAKWSTVKNMDESMLISQIDLKSVYQIVIDGCMKDTGKKLSSKVFDKLSQGSDLYAIIFVLLEI